MMGSHPNAPAPPARRRALTALAALLPLTLVAVDASAYERSRTPEAGADMEWNTRRIVYLINEAGSEDMDFSTLTDQVRLSFKPWADEPCAELEFVYGGPTAHGADLDDIGYDNKNVVVFREEAGLWTFDTDVIAVTTVSFCEGVGGACDLAGEILDADIEVNGADFTFSTATPTPRLRFDLRNTMTHEVGHLLGFDHTRVAEATMFASAPRGESSKRDLHPDDIDGLCAVYAEIHRERNPDDDDGLGCAARPGPAPAGGAWLAALLLIALARRR